MAHIPISSVLFPSSFVHRSRNCMIGELSGREKQHYWGNWTFSQGVGLLGLQLAWRTPQSPFLLPAASLSNSRRKIFVYPPLMMPGTVWKPYFPLPRPFSSSLHSNMNMNDRWCAGSLPAVQCPSTVGSYWLFLGPTCGKGRVFSELYSRSLNLDLPDFGSLNSKVGSADIELLALG